MTNNSIVGGDYSVGADGSFPLLMSVLLFVNHWPAILDHYPQFRSKYPSGCAKDGKLVFRDDDFVLAGQVLLDMASHHHAESDSAAVYDEARGQRPLRPAASQTLVAFSIACRHTVAQHPFRTVKELSLCVQGFNRELTVVGNQLSGAVCGVSLYRTRSSLVENNDIDAPSGGALGEMTATHLLELRGACRYSSPDLTGMRVQRCTVLSWA